MRAVLTALAAALLLSSCASGILDHDDGRWLVTRNVGETDYELNSALLFAPNSADISPRAHDLLASIAADARKRERVRIEVEGFTDTSGSHEHNMSLSQARAERVADVLAHQGIKADRIRARGYGETRLAVATRDGVDEPRNRRVVIRFLES